MTATKRILVTIVGPFAASCWLALLDGMTYGMYWGATHQWSPDRARIGLTNGRSGKGRNIP